MGITEISLCIALFLFLGFLIYDLYFTHKKLNEKTEAEIKYRQELILTLKCLRNKIGESNVETND